MIVRSLRCAVVAATFSAAVASEARPAVIFDGVAAGDVTSTDAILWARADNGGSTTRLTAQIATDPGFTNIVSALDGTTTAASDFTLKLDATGLSSNTRYYFISSRPTASPARPDNSPRLRWRARRSM
jgi:alkaline phosphatase D